MALKELSNVKVNWSDVLEAEIALKEDLYPELNVRNRYSELIRMLETNQLMSRVVYSTDHISAYCFLLEAEGDPHKLYANIGFSSIEEASDPRVSSILDWLSDLARTRRKTIIFDRPFNAPETFDGLCEIASIRKIERAELRLVPSISGNTDIEEPRLEQGLELKQFDLSNVQAFASAEYAAYLNGPEEVFLPPSPEELSKLIGKLFGGNSKQKIIEDASFVAIVRGQIIGGIIASSHATGAMISDVFVSPDYQGKGVSKPLILASIKRLVAEYPEVTLWSMLGSKAYQVYREAGFNETDRTAVLYFTERPAEKPVQ